MVRWRQIDGTANQRCYCTGICRCLRERVSHFSRAVVGNVSYWIQGFTGGACCNDDPFACQFARRKQFRSSLGNS